METHHEISGVSFDKAHQQKSCSFFFVGEGGWTKCCCHVRLHCRVEISRIDTFYVLDDTNAYLF